MGPQRDVLPEISKSNDQSQSRPKSNRPSVNGPRPIAIKQSAILPSLSIANSNHISPSSSPVQHIRRGSSAINDKNESVEEFFKDSSEPADKTAQDLFAENLTDKLQPQYIQPKSTFANKIKSSVVDPKKDNDGFNSPSLKISRSGTNLQKLNSQSHLTPTLTTLSAIGSNPGLARAQSSLGRSGLSMTLNNNSSTSVIDPITEDEEHPEVFDDCFEVDSDGNEDDWDNDFNKLNNPRAKIKLAPFGGFSNPKLEHGVTSTSNIFETSPWKVLFAAKGNGSLIKAVKMSVGENIIKNRKWVGTLAMPSDEVPDHVINDIAKTLKDDYNSEAIFPSDLTFSGHYKSFCKQVLWPTLHYEIPDNPKSKAFEDHSWGHYKALNQMMADKIIKVYEEENGDLDPNDPENMIWIHDYHLLLVPQMIREKLPRAKIGFFLHVSFPSSEVFRCLAQREALLKGMLGASAISFQTDEYVRHFLQTCNRLLLADSSDYGVTYDGRFTMVNTIPVGIDAKSLYDYVISDNVQSWRHKIRQRWKNQNLIVSRDKLDKLRGIKEKLLAYEKFLQLHPEYIVNTVLIQVCIGTASDDIYASEVMKIVSRINSLAENISVSQPVVLLQQDITFDQYLALQLESDIFVVSSMREGLNLTSHEFIIAATERKSPLMLSEFVGSSQLLSTGDNGAILINPWDMKDFSEKFYQSLTMSSEEKAKRWKFCYDVVAKHDYRSWIKGCLSSIDEAWKINHKRNMLNLTPFNSSIFHKFYNQQGDGSRLFILNLETASAVTSLNESSVPNVPVSLRTRDVKNSDILPPSSVASLLTHLLSDRRNQVYLCSYLKRLTLDTLFKRVPNLGLVAENGAFIKMIHSNKWVSLINEEEVNKWMPPVQKLVDAKVERLPGSKADVQDCTIIFNPGRSFNEDKQRSMDHMGDLIQHVNELFDKVEGIHASLIRNNVIIHQNHLCLRAVHFLVNFYNHNPVNGFGAKEVNDSATSTPVKEKRSAFEPEGKDRITHLFISGGTTLIDEPIFNYGNTLNEEEIIPNVVTVAALDNDSKSTSAIYGVAGRNELLSILSSSDSYDA